MSQIVVDWSSGGSGADLEGGFYPRCLRFFIPSSKVLSLFISYKYIVARMSTDYLKGIRLDLVWNSTARARMMQSIAINRVYGIGLTAPS